VGEYPPASVDLGLEGRTALVCGASSGLGLASAEALAAEGANVALFARRADELERHADRIGGLAVVGDVTVPGDTARAVEATVDSFGGLDILVWNHGGPPPGPATSVTPEAVQQALDLILKPLVRLVQAALPHLERSSGGRVIGITSLAALEPTDHLALSNMLRPAVHGYLKTLANELGPRNITVNCVAPGRIATARLEQLYPGGPSAQQLEEIPLGRWGEPREFGDVVCFFASERARYVSGQTLVVDGGLQKAIF
jgi:3-oxoacyl-[acyl-carrier protein] reductase